MSPGTTAALGTYRRGSPSGSTLRTLMPYSNPVASCLLDANHRLVAAQIHRHLPRLAAHWTILDVTLHATAEPIDDDLVRLPAIWTLHDDRIFHWRDLRMWRDRRRARHECAHREMKGPRRSMRRGPRGPVSVAVGSPAGAHRRATDSGAAHLRGCHLH